MPWSRPHSSCFIPGRAVVHRSLRAPDACAWVGSAAGRYSRIMTEHRRYPSDLSDARWELVEPVLTAWRAERRGRGLDIGRPPNHDLRSLLDAVLYVNRTGIPWCYLPHDYPHWNTVYAYFARWQEEGVFRPAQQPPAPPSPQAGRP